MSPEDLRIRAVEARLEMVKGTQQKILKIWTEADRRRRRLESQTKLLEQELEDLRQGQLLLGGRELEMLEPLRTAS